MTSPVPVPAPKGMDESLALLRVEVLSDDDGQVFAFRAPYRGATGGRFVTAVWRRWDAVDAKPPHR